ncbi:hypothetical protein F4805DRAFT_358950 [Annulohypoxylon moriforme]|nr:hypothetical protein F4805DRAFT_358950 [Annulohypoxylon moriforme]
MATVANRGADRAAALYQKGQKLYKASQYDVAEKAFLKAMDLCSCGVAVQKQPRIDNEILSGIEKKDLKGALTKLPASQRCNSRLHLDTLDSLIATYETQNRLDEALEFSLKMVNLSPREPKSYLRLGKVLRLKNQQTTAYHNYKQGMELVKRKNPNHALLSKLQAQKDKVLPLATFDPVAELPIELIRMIFGLMDTRTRGRCLGVSKTWKTVLTTESLRDIWKIQEYKFSRFRQTVSPKLFANFVSSWNYAGRSVTELTIDGCLQFLITAKLERFFRFFQDLKVLDLREPHAFITLGPLPKKAKTPKLRKLFLGRGMKPAGGLLNQLLESSSESLEELSVFSLPPPDISGPNGTWYYNWPRLEKLKTLRLARTDLPLVTGLDGIVESTPNVEEAWLDIHTYDLIPMLYRWTRLQSVFIGGAMSFDDNSPPNNPIPFVDAHEQLRELHLEVRVEMGMLDLLLEKAHAPGRFFEKMEKISVLVNPGVPTGELFDFFIRPGIESGTLREIHFDPIPTRDFLQSPRVPTIPAWLSSPNVTYFSFAGFTRESLHEHRCVGDAVLEIADRFPNLSTVDISNEPFPDTLLAKLIQKGVKTIYCHPGQPRVDLREWASRKFGAQIIMTRSPHVPAYHPDRFRSTDVMPGFSPSCF